MNAKLRSPGNALVHKNARPIWQEAMLELGRENERVVALTADLSRSICTEQFRRQFPERYFNAGIAEQGMLGVAAGLAMEGFLPYCTSYAPFLSMRALEQWRTDICYMNLNVTLISGYGGIATAGPTHSGLEDAGLLRGIPNASIVCPSDVTMVRKVFLASLRYDGPLYIRLGQGADDPELYEGEYDFCIGKAICARPGKDAAILSFGLTLRYAVEAARRLAEEGIQAAVYDFHTLKPLDMQAVLEAASTGAIITVEDHSVYNGLGSAVAETLLEHGLTCKLRRLGIPDVYPSYGPLHRLHAKYGYDTQGIIRAVKEVIS